MSIPSGFKSLPLPLSQLSLAAVLQCGQSFRWSIFPLRIPNIEPTVPAEATPQYEYRLCLRDRVVCLRQSPDMLFYRSVFPSPALSPTEELQRESETVSWIRDYFQLGVDLMKLYEQWAEADPVFKRLQDRFEGIRMLRQDPFECLLSFICSSNNNIARITKMVKSLCTQYSPPLLKMAPPNADGLDEEVQPYYPFPRPSVLASPEVSAQLRSLGFGYRAEFIQRTAQILVEAHGVSMSSEDKLEPSERWLYTLRNMPTARAREELLKFVGVGRKVADCVMLMSLDKKEVIPVDTHVHQIAVKHYGLPGSNSKTKANMTPKLYDQVNSKLVAIWGDYAGWAHSVLFTSDLRAFADYGLPTPSPSPTKSSRVSSPKAGESSPAPPPVKRKRAQAEENQTDGVVIDGTVVPIEDLSLADRVKRRKRGQTRHSSFEPHTP